MKKTYLLFSGLLLTTGIVNAQTNGVKSADAAQITTSFNKSVKNRPGIGGDRAADDIIWEDGFEDAALWTAAGPSGDYSISGWTIGTETNGWYFGGAPSDMGTTGSFARFVNGDPGAAPFPIEDGPFTMMYNETIDLSGVPAPHIEFEQYGARFITVQAVEVSTDGGMSWTVVGTNDDIAPLTNAGGSVYGQPETRRFNITAAIAADPSNVMVRLSWDGAMNGPDMNYIEYAWFVDNIRIVEGHNLDSDIQASYIRSGVGDWFETGLEYYLIAESQLTGIDFAAETINQGASTFTGLHLEATVTKSGATVFSGTSDDIDLASTAQDSLGTTTQFTPTELGIHSVNYVFVGDGADTYADNDELNDYFLVTDYVYGRDNGGQTTDITNFAGNGGFPFAIGNGMQIFADGVIGGLDIVIGDGNTGKLMYGSVMRWNDALGDFEYVDQTSDHIITAAEDGGTVRLFFEDPIIVSEGELILVLAGHYGEDVGFGGAQDVTDGVWGFDAANTRFGLADAFAIMVRALMIDFTSVNETIEANFTVGQNMPNPFADNTIINYELNEAAAVTIEFMDVTGKVVKTINNGTQQAGAYTVAVDGNDFAEGVYFYTFTIGTQKVTKRMVIAK